MIEKIIAGDLQINVSQVTSTIKLLEEGGTIPFISRYRKEATGSLDEVQVGGIKELFEKYSALILRKQSILETIEQQGALTSELEAKIENTWSSTELEDLYLPYKPKRRTRATVARERGLEPLANIIMAQNTSDVRRNAERFLTNEVPSVEDALSGAGDIIAERVSENERTREGLRRSFQSFGLVQSKVVKGRDGELKYSDYFDANDPLKRISSHRFLAMLRGEEEGVLKVSIQVDKDLLQQRIERQFIKPGSSTEALMREAIKDSIKRLLYPSIETQMLSQTKERADEEAIRVFADNLRQLLLSSPLGQKSVLALDPGFRTGCKVVALSSAGDLLENVTVYPHPPVNKPKEAGEQLKKLVKKYDIQAIAIGDGTAGRESEAFVKDIDFSAQLDIYMVSEDGASVYSASELARKEFPSEDVTVRGAVSIGRRLMDPLSELVKIDPKSIGVGQYQHSVDQSKLKSRLQTVVESCVNKVGVNINTASKEILTYVSGLGDSLAENIVAHRSQNGEFMQRKDLLKVKRLGAKAYEQAAGFLRVVGGDNPLDNSAVHPESYHIVKAMAKDLGLSVEQLLEDEQSRSKIEAEKYVSDKVGMPTIVDILDSLEKRGLDPRSQLQAFSFDASVRTIDDLKEGMILPAIITNVTAFGAFADIGIKQDGLIHISQMAQRRIASPSEVVHLGDKLSVRVLEVDRARSRVSLSLKGID